MNQQNKENVFGINYHLANLVEESRVNVKKLKKNNLDKIVKSGSDYYYINKYGYKKPLGNNKNDFDPSCNEKQIVNGSVNEHLEYAVNYNDNLSSVLKRCDSGNYNIKFCKGDDCDHAYLSPKGKLSYTGKILGNQ